MTTFGRCLLFFWMVVFLPTSTLRARDLRFGGSLRGYQFLGAEDSPLAQRRDAELWILRLTPEGSWGRHLSFEVHGLLSVLSPPLVGISRIAVSDSRKFLPLDRDFTDSARIDLLGSLDRLNLQIDFESVKFTLGRQAVTWGVGFFWPSMDLFAPFAPQQIDREYKAGVDAVRVTVPLGPLSELEVIGASLGSSVRQDGAAGALLRLNVGSADFGLMGGKFHRDTVAGGFLTADVQGTGLRGELTWTQSGDPEDALRDRRQFWRGSVGLVRQVIPSITLTLELAWNGFGSSDPSEYLSLLQADRTLRGEVNALAQTYSGFSVSWLLHPLFTFSHALLINWNDRSSLWIPALNWSTGNNSEILFGAQFGIGKGLSEDQSPRLRSEYGSATNTLFGALKFYF
ncbi:MAG: hypothetical protein ACE5MK_05235 [Acidobacteriota bacterium]